MAIIIPNLSQIRSACTPGERRVAAALQRCLEDDYVVWYDIPVGKQRRYPDFIVLHPRRGLLFLEVKDWKIDTVQQMDKNSVRLLTNSGLQTCAHPLTQARSSMFPVVNLLKQDTFLQAASGIRAGQLKVPYAYGVIFTNILRKQIHQKLTDHERDVLLPDHLVLYQEDLREDVDAEAFQKKLWQMFPYDFGQALTLPEIDRIRWHLFPEVRIDARQQGDLFEETSDDNLVKLPEQQASAIPDVVKIMDIQQEQLARSLGMGHRVIHGVAGSGKTLILGYRCAYLAQTMQKPILVLCYNITLAAKLRAVMAAKKLSQQVQVYHFHDWCAAQIRLYHVDVIPGEQVYYERMVQSVIDAVARGQIPREQYGAVLIDEGHDFEASWLKLITQMVHPDEDSLLLLYDDAQSIYQRGQGGLDFSLSSVGIKAKGRTTVLRLNYRNTQQILQFAYAFAQPYLHGQEADDDHIPLVVPESVGQSGDKPRFYQLPRFSDEIQKAVQCVRSWQSKHLDLHNIAILVAKKCQAEQVNVALIRSGIATQLLVDVPNKKAYQPYEDRVAIMTLHSSKGLEFSHVLILGVGSMGREINRVANDAKVLYVGMTRAQRALVVTGSGDGQFVQQLQKNIHAA